MDKMINGAGNRQRDKVDDEPYAELELFFQRPPISQSKCSDMILYWGVSILFQFQMPKLNPNIYSLTKNILYFNQWLRTSWPFQDHVVLLNDHFQCQREQMMFVNIKWMERSLEPYRGWELLFEMAVWKLKVRLGWKLIQILCFRKIICKIILNFSWIQVWTWTWTSRTRFKRFGVWVHQSTGLNLIIKVRVWLKEAWTWTKLDRGQSTFSGLK